MAKDNNTATQNQNTLNNEPVAEEQVSTKPDLVNTKPASPKNPKKKRLILIGLVVAIILLIAGSAGATYYYYYLPNTPKNVVKQALANQLAEDKFMQSARLEGNLSVQGENMPSVNLTFNVAKNESTGFSANVKAYGVSGDIVTTDGKTVYFRLAGLSGLDALIKQYVGNLSDEEKGLVQSLTPLVSKLDNQWYQIDSSLLGSSGGEASLKLSSELSQEDLDEIADIYLDNEFIVVDEKGGETTIGGKQVTEYRLHIDGQKLKSFAADLKAANIEGVTITDEQLNSLNEFVDKNDLSKYPFSLWIDENKNIVQFFYSHQYEKAKVELKLTLTQTGGEVKIETPSDSKNMFELFGDLEPLLQSFDESELESF